MTTLEQARATLRDALKSAGMDAFSVTPEVADPPFAYAAPDEPYLSPDGASFGQLIARHQVVLIASAGVNEATADELDQMIVTAVRAIDDAVDTFEVGRPGTIGLNSQSYLAVAISTTTEISIQED